MPRGVTVSGQDSALGRPACVLEGQNSLSLRKEVTDRSVSGRTELGTLPGVLMPQALMACGPCGALGGEGQTLSQPSGNLQPNTGHRQEGSDGRMDMSLNMRQVPGRGAGQGVWRASQRGHSRLEGKEEPA